MGKQKNCFKRISGLFAAAKVRLPGFLRGLEFAQTLRGNLPWNKVVEPSKRLAESGFIVSEELAYEATKTAEHGMLYGQLRAGETLRLPMLAETLDAVGQYGCDSESNKFSQTDAKIYLILGKNLFSFQKI